MKEIEFHFNVADKLTYSCRLLRKVHRSGVKAVVTADHDVLQALDQLLWSFSPTEFLPHCMHTAGESLKAATPVVLASSPDNCAGDGVLINLGTGIPTGFERFERFIELVSSASDDKALGRGRWKTYKTQGFELVQHDLAAGKESA